MDDASVSKSDFSWLWVIEALASSKEIATSTLKDLINIAPVKPDVFSKNTRELVARRCLESLFDSTKGSNSGISSSLDSKVQLDNSQTCEDALLHIIQEIPLENLRKDEAELLKWDAHPFIMYKKDTAVKSELEQLKESVLVNGNHLEHLSGVKCNDLLRNGEDCTYAENMGAKESTTSLDLENRNKYEDLHGMKCLPSKRNRADSTDDHVGYMHENQLGKNERNDFPSNAKKLKGYASTSLESKKEKLVYQHGKEVLENSSRRLPISEKEGFLTEKDQMATVDGGSILEDCHSGYSSHHPACCDNADIPCNGSMMPQQISGAEPSQHHVESLPTNAALPDESVPESCLGISTTIPQQTCRNEPCQNTSLHETNHDAELHTEAIPTNDDLADKIQNQIEESLSKHEINFQQKEFSSAIPNGPQHSVATVDPGNGAEASGDSDGHHHEKIDLAAKMHDFLSSQRMNGQDQSASSEQTQQDLCMKCNEGSELLVCKTTSCPLVVHESCLDTLPKIDIKGNFLCPFCSYSIAISEYLEAKKKACLARKELAIFIHKVIGDRAKEIPDLFYTKESIPSSNGKQQREEREKEIEKNGKLQVLDAERDRGRVVNPESSTVGGVDGNQLRADHVDVADKFSHEKRNDVSVNHSDRQEGTQRQMPEQHSTYGIEKPVSACATEDEISEDESKSSTSAYSLRTRKQEMQCKPQARFQLRRKKVPWTADEEDILREGVQKFSGVTTMERGIPWRKIFEFGSHVFLNGRTTVDLKDKWRNMCKASSLK
ncbi:hypothetical protein L6164_034099 [Bauhinia variegata]|uniref:Uncharacterized protein n=1 Tax=Bauhinia variegata TaxID=167791 RepID=A0ACB9KTU0_BAUVA|nr:hypothetical protein L6164_034099 [Bauhinia variegata]